MIKEEILPIKSIHKISSICNESWYCMFLSFIKGMHRSSCKKNGTHFSQQLIIKTIFEKKKTIRLTKTVASEIVETYVISFHFIECNQNDNKIWNM